MGLETNITETSVALQGIANAKQSAQEVIFDASKVVNAFNEAERLLKLQDAKIKDMKGLLQVFHDIQENGGIVANEVFDRIKTILT